MPEEIEDPTEHLHEQIHEAAEGHYHPSGFKMQVVLSTAVLAVVAAGWHAQRLCVGMSSNVQPVSMLTRSC